MKKKSKKDLRGKGKSLLSQLSRAQPSPESGGRFRAKRMNRSEYRKQQVKINRQPRIFRQYARRIVAPRGFALLEQIHAEIAPKIAPEILPEIVPPVVRFASRRATDQGESQTLSRFALCGGEFEHSVGIYDRDQVAGGEERELTPILPVDPKEREFIAE